MAKTLEQYTSEISQSYQGTRNALQNQLNAIQGNLETTNNQINQQYANQQAQLQRNANNAASAASIRAAGNGGSFGGNAAIANQKYYDQTFAPAQMQLQTNQAQDIENARVRADQNKLSLEGQLASLQDTIAQAAQQRYYEALEADRQYELQRQQLAAQKAAQSQQNAYYRYLMQAAQSQQTSKAKTYIGNDDYRGWLNYLSKNGDQNATILLKYAGNDGGVSNRGTTTIMNGPKAQSFNIGGTNDYYYKQWLSQR